MIRMIYIHSWLPLAFQATQRAIYECYSNQRLKRNQQDLEYSLSNTQTLHQR